MDDLPVARYLTQTFLIIVVMVGIAACTGVAGPVQPQGGLPVPGTPYSITCYAGIYACPMPYSIPVGAACSCPGLGAPSFGVAR